MPANHPLVVKTTSLGYGDSPPIGGVNQKSLSTSQAMRAFGRRLCLTSTCTAPVPVFGPLQLSFTSTASTFFHWTKYLEELIASGLLRVSLKSLSDLARLLARCALLLVQTFAISNAAVAASSKHSTSVHLKLAADSVAQAHFSVAQAAASTSPAAESNYKRLDAMSAAQFFSVRPTSLPGGGPGLFVNRHRVCMCTVVGVVLSYGREKGGSTIEWSFLLRQL